MKPPLYFESSAFMSPSSVLIFSPKRTRFRAITYLHDQHALQVPSSNRLPFAAAVGRFAAHLQLTGSFPHPESRRGGVIPRFLQEIKFLCCSHPECGRSANECSAITLPSRAPIISSRSESGVVCKMRRRRVAALFLSRLITVDVCGSIGSLDRSAPRSLASPT